jgi:hypothetical protein
MPYSFPFALDAHALTCIFPAFLINAFFRDAQPPANMLHYCPRWAEPFTSLPCGQLVMRLKKRGSKSTLLCQSSVLSCECCNN